jgi:hypothetical protein
MTLLFLFLFWIFPIFVAFSRGHKNAIPITLLNFFGFAYPICFIWSFSSNVKQDRSVNLKDWQLLAIFAVLCILFTLYLYIFSSKSFETLFYFINEGL